MMRFSLIVAVLGATLLPACRQDKPPATPADPVRRADYPHNVSLRGLDKVVVGGEALVEPATAQRPLRVTVPVRNTDSKGIRAQYLFEFFDAKGQPVGRSAGWQYRLLSPGMQVFLEGYALDTAATDWRVTIRPAR